MRRALSDRMPDEIRMSSGFRLEHRSRGGTSRIEERFVRSAFAEPEHGVTDLSAADHMYFGQHQQAAQSAVSARPRAAS